MRIPHIGRRPHSYTREMKWRHRYSWLLAGTTVLLLAWGAFVTSINAGMVFPDWPTTLGSYNLFNPVDRWWSITPYLAEHGHRLIAMVVGLMTAALAVWTWRADPRRWIRWLGAFAFFLVCLQGVLGGLRVLLVSVDLAIVHACAAQLFFAVVVAMTVFTSPGWLGTRDILPDSASAEHLWRAAAVTTGVVYGQIILGALLRHQGLGIHPIFVSLHVIGAFAVTAAVFTVFVYCFKYFWRRPLLRRTASYMIGLLGLQFALGIAALFVLLLEAPGALRSPLQIGLNSIHLIVGALLFASVVQMALYAMRRPQHDEPLIADRPAPGNRAAGAAAATAGRTPDPVGETASTPRGDATHFPSISTSA